MTSYYDLDADPTECSIFYIGDRPVCTRNERCVAAMVSLVKRITIDEAALHVAYVEAAKSLEGATGMRREFLRQRLYGSRGERRA